jgi:photosystem II stability/assembly factor-like uncharacterized protein
VISLLALSLAIAGASLRGVHAVDERVIWASGSKGTVLVSADSGKTWAARDVTGAESLDFRSIYAFSEQVAYVLSSGEGEKSKLFRTDDGGLHWALLYTSPEGFLDGLKFWDEHHGIILGDPVGGSFVVLTTDNEGRNWTRRALPASLPDEGAFAASNSSLAVRGASEAWFATSGARVFHTMDRGATWTVAQTPVRHDAKGAGIFSLFFSDARHGLAVGGDYTKLKDDAHNIALTEDGGRMWTEPASHPSGYRSAVVCRQQECVATGPSGSDVSRDGGRNWAPIEGPGYHALTLAGNAVYGSGSDGRLGLLNSASR